MVRGGCTLKKCVNVIVWLFGNCDANPQNNTRQHAIWHLHAEHLGDSDCTFVTDITVVEVNGLDFSIVLQRLCLW